MTVSPDYDDATGEFLGFEAKPNQAFSEEIDDLPIEEEDALIDADLDDPDYQSPEVELADAAEEILTTEFAPDPMIADAVMAIEHDNSSEADLVQHLISECYQGNLTPEEAFNYALESPYDKQELMLAFETFKSLLND